MRQLLKLTWLAAASTVIWTNAASQAASSEPVAYSFEFFDRFAPQTALNIVEQVPGFSLNQGKSRRGLAGAAGNVLIDGTWSGRFGSIETRDRVRIEPDRTEGIERTETRQRNSGLTIGFRLQGQF